MPSILSGDEQKVEFFNIVGGKPRTADQSHQVIDPRTEESLWSVPLASRLDLDDAVEAGRKAFKTWKRSTVPERQALIRDVAKVILANSDLLVSILMKETGKSHLMANTEVVRAVEHYGYFATLEIEDEVQYEDETIKIIATHAPYGVIGAISPWNFPIILSTIKICSALATGNCIIIKPSPYTPYTILKVCELAQSVVPPGVLQAINGGTELGEQMTLHPGIAHISFTGTIAVGKRIMQNCAKTLKKVVLELAGNDAAIICEDVDLDTVVPKVANGCLLHAGQVCVASKRIYVHETLYRRFLSMLVEEVKKYTINNDPTVPSVFGPLSNRANFERCQGIIEDCRKNKYDIVTGIEGTAEKRGFWINPTIVAKPPDDSLLVSEEQFGPIIPVLSWTEEDDVIDRANLDNAGLGASVYCKDPERAQKIARQLESGTVWINMQEKPHRAGFFSGQKSSGLGGELGKQGLLSYCHTQSIQIAK